MKNENKIGTGKIEVTASEWKLGVEHMSWAFEEMHPHAFDNARGLDECVKIMVEYLISHTH